MFIPSVHQFVKITLFIVVFDNRVKAEYEGDSCNHTTEGVPGICKKLDQCQDAIQKLKLGVHPQNCGFVNAIPIVCCPISTTTKTETVVMTSTKVELPIGERSRQACENYKMLAYKRVNSSSFGSEDELVENCPWKDKGVAVISEGVLVEAGNFPHMALIGYGTLPSNYSFLCGGSLISDKYVLTAAHCLSSRAYGYPQFIRLGDIDYDDSDDDQYVQQISINKRIEHPLYKAYLKYHDIALLELDHPAQLSLYVKPICLYIWDPTTKVHSGMVTGWGTGGKGLTNTKLLRGSIQYFSPELCRKIYDFTRSIPKGIDIETQICFGPTKQTHGDTCQISFGCIRYSVKEAELVISATDDNIVVEGDSGGPIQIYNKDVYCSYYIFGITSFGKGCGIPNIPAVYTKLYKYIEWIESIVWP